MTIKSRVGFDIDGDEAGWRLRARRAYHALSRDAAEVEVRISSSGEGLHLIGYFEQSLSDAQKDRYARTYGDDPTRTDLDVERRRHGHTTNVHWTTKGAGTPNERHADLDFEHVDDAIAHIDAAT